MVKDIFGSGLQCNVSLYIPATINVREWLRDNEKYINQAAKLFSDLFGGATAYQTRGYYKDSTGSIVKESVVVIKSYTDELTREQLESIRELAEYIREELSQECVSVEINDRLYFV